MKTEPTPVEQKAASRPDDTRGDASAFRVWSDAERAQLRLLAAAAPVFDVSAATD